MTEIGFRKYTIVAILFYLNLNGVQFIFQVIEESWLQNLRCTRNRLKLVKLICITFQICPQFNVRSPLLFLRVHEFSTVNKFVVLVQVASSSCTVITSRCTPFTCPAAIQICVQMSFTVHKLIFNPLVERLKAGQNRYAVKCWWKRDDLFPLESSSDEQFLSRLFNVVF